MRIWRPIQRFSAKAIEGRVSIRRLGRVSVSRFDRCIRRGGADHIERSRGHQMQRSKIEKSTYRRSPRYSEHILGHGRVQPLGHDFIRPCTIEFNPRGPDIDQPDLSTQQFRILLCRIGIPVRNLVSFSIRNHDRQWSRGGGARGVREQMTPQVGLLRAGDFPGQCIDQSVRAVAFETFKCYLAFIQGFSQQRLHGKSHDRPDRSDHRCH